MEIQIREDIKQASEDSSILFKSPTKFIEGKEALDGEIKWIDVELQNREAGIAIRLDEARKIAEELEKLDGEG